MCARLVLDLDAEAAHRRLVPVDQELMSTPLKWASLVSISRDHCGVSGSKNHRLVTAAVFDVRGTDPEVVRAAIDGLRSAIPTGLIVRDVPGGFVASLDEKGDVWLIHLGDAVLYLSRPTRPVSTSIDQLARLFPELTHLGASR
ncbi:MAG: hypothetical protein ACKOIA_06880 [Acidimicrobiia bacterium]